MLPLKFVFPQSLKTFLTTELRTKSNSQKALELLYVIKSSVLPSYRYSQKRKIITHYNSVQVTVVHIAASTKLDGFKRKRRA